MAGWTEDERLDALARLDVLSGPDSADFDTLTAAAARVCATPMAAITFVTETRQWLRSRVGVELHSTPRDQSFCAHALAAGGMMVVPDAREDARFADNPLVTGAPHLRFYAGAVIRSPEGLPMGALCVLDVDARPQGLMPDQEVVLRALAEEVTSRLALRRSLETDRALLANREAALAASTAREDRFHRVLDSGATGWWEWDVQADRVRGNPELARTFELPPGTAETGAPLAHYLAHVHPLDRVLLQDAITDAVATGDVFHEEYRVIHPGRDVVRWISARGRCLRDADGLPSLFTGVLTDVTGRRVAEERLREADLGRELAMQAARLGRFDHDLVTGVRFYDARALELLELSPEQVQDPQAVFARVHAEDRERVQAAQAAAKDPDRAGPYRETYRVVDDAGETTRWITGVGQSIFSDGVCTRFLGVLEDVTEAKRSEEQRRLLTRELDHRVKNSMALVQGLVETTLRGAVDLPSARAAVAERLSALGRAHDLLTRESWTAAAVPELVEQTVESLGLPRDRLDLAGGPVRLGAQPALQLALVLHELATNAVKYGALSSAAGRVAAEWSVTPVDGSPSFTFDWRESGGPPVRPPSRRGFGSRLVVRAAEAAFHGRATLDYRAEGVRWSLRAPYAGLAGPPPAGDGLSDAR